MRPKPSRRAWEVRNCDGWDFGYKDNNGRLLLPSHLEFQVPRHCPIPRHPDCCESELERA